MIKSQSGAEFGNSSPHVSVTANSRHEEIVKDIIYILISFSFEDKKGRRKLTLDMGERRGDVVCSTVMSNVVLNLLVIVV